MVDLQRNAGGATRHTTMSIAFQDCLARPLPGPSVAAASRVIPRVAWHAANGDALSAPGPPGQNTAIEAAPHSPSPPLASLPKRADTAPDRCRVGRVAEEHVAEPAAGAAAQALAIGNWAVGLGEPPSMHALAHG